MLTILTILTIWHWHTHTNEHTAPHMLCALTHTRPSVRIVPPINSIIYLWSGTATCTNILRLRRLCIWFRNVTHANGPKGQRTRVAKSQNTLRERAVRHAHTQIHRKMRVTSQCCWCTRQKRVKLNASHQSSTHTHTFKHFTFNPVATARALYPCIGESLYVSVSSTARRRSISHVRCMCAVWLSVYCCVRTHLLDSTIDDSTVLALWHGTTTSVGRVLHTTMRL